MKEDTPESLLAESGLEASSSDAATLKAIGALLEPIAQLAIGRGLRFAQIEEALKQALVDAATQALRQAHPNLQPHRMVSRISTTSGINRREVTRLSQQGTQAEANRSPSLATKVFTRWRTDPAYLLLADTSATQATKTAQGDARTPMALPRQGPAPSFEALAHSVTRDVHPRCLLDELCRLNLARWDEAADTVHLLRDAFVPQGDWGRMLAFLGDNVGDHLQAAVQNVLATERPPHFEQAVFADELSAQSLPAIKTLVQAHWQRLLAESVPLLQEHIDADRAAGRTQNHRVRIGLFSYSEAGAAPSPAPTDTDAPAASPEGPAP